MSDKEEDVVPRAGELTHAVPRADLVEVEPQPQPRPPRDLQGLLRFAMEATKAEDAPANSRFTPMDEQRRKFLEEALKGLTTNLAEEISEAIKVLSDSEKIRSVQLGQELPRDVDKAFITLLDIVDDMDIANDFYKLGGFAVFPVCIASENETIRAFSCRMLAECCQNNPFCQARALEHGLVNVLISLVQTESGDTLSSAMYALSCACRSYAPAAKELISQGGCSVLTNLLSSDDIGVKTKVSFLICNMCRQHPEAKEKFIELNLIEKMADLIKLGRREGASEQYLRVLLELVQHGNDTVIRQCLDQELNLMNTLEDYLKTPALQDESLKDERILCLDIIRAINEFPDDTERAEVVDR